ncbi:unnamed protein product [Closterium sp. NIES-64]|nr:unnamed protein product [Closterium sp. NIES-64]
MEVSRAKTGGADGGGGCSTVEVPVNYGKVPGASDADVRERDEQAERAAVDVPTPEEGNVDVQWEDVEELWSYDVYHCERDEAETPSDHEDDVANAVIRDAEEWSNDSDEWWVAGRYDGEEVDVWVAGQDE